MRGGRRRSPVARRDLDGAGDGEAAREPERVGAPLPGTPGELVRGGGRDAVLAGDDAHDAVAADGAAAAGGGEGYAPAERRVEERLAGPRAQHVAPREAEDAWAGPARHGGPSLARRRQGSPPLSP